MKRLVTYIPACALFAVSLVATTAADASERREFAFQAYPVAEEDCRQTAQSLGQMFAAETGRPVLSSECRGGDYSRGGFEIVVNYFGREISDQPAVEERLYGAYETGPECLEDLDFQKQLFIDQTGLSISQAYCSPKGYLFIYSLKNPGLKRIIFDSDIRGGIGIGGDFLIDDIDATEGQIADAVTTSGGAVSRVLIKESGHAYIYYYAPTRLNLMFIQYTGYKTKEDCDAERHKVSEVIRTFDGNTLVQICAASERFPVPGAELLNFVAYPYPFMFSQIYTLYMEDVGLQYESLEQCNDDKGRIYDFYRTSLGKDVYGSSCTFDDEEQKYRLLIFRSTN